MVVANVCLQVERRVVNQLALAHERQLIHKGCSLRLTVSAEPEKLTKDPQSRSSEAKVPTIKLQMVQEGSKDKYVDIDLNKGHTDFIS